MTINQKNCYCGECDGKVSIKKYLEENRHT